MVRFLKDGPRWRGRYRGDGLPSGRTAYDAPCMVDVRDAATLLEHYPDDFEAVPESPAPPSVVAGTPTYPTRMMTPTPPPDAED